MLNIKKKELNNTVNLKIIFYYKGIYYNYYKTIILKKSNVLRNK